jgi:hypothetical protein
MRCKHSQVVSPEMVPGQVYENRHPLLDQNLVPGTSLSYPTLDPLHVMMDFGVQHLFRVQKGVLAGFRQTR